MENKIILTPAQQRAATGLLGGIARGDVVVLRGECGRGKTTVLGHVQACLGGVLLGAREFLSRLMTRRPEAVEEAFLDLIESALDQYELVMLDDLQLITAVVNGCDYPRAYLLDVALTAVLSEAAAKGRKLAFAVEDEPPAPLRYRAYSWTIGPLEPEDYECVCRAHLGEKGLQLDYARIHAFAPQLNAHQLKAACRWLAGEAGLDTARLIEYLREQNMASNVELEEVPQVDWNALKGVSEVIRALEAKIALPLENLGLAAEMGLKPKRGVLLGGPPGTGKTTIGRALAHRLKGKFFLIDGTAVAGSGDFYDTVEKVFDAAKRNAPSVIFIDDADVIFQGGSHGGFYRYLLTMLDGLESARASQVCVMMTAMDSASLPPALVRSGRIELWLEMRLPDAEARAAILREKISALPAPIGEADVGALAAASRGLTGADLKAVVEDGKLLFAHDKALRQPLRPVEEYFLEAIETLRTTRRGYGRSKPELPVGSVKLGFCVEER